MKELKHLIYFESLLEDTNNELVRKAESEGDLALGYTCFHAPEVLLNLGSCFSVRLRAPHTTSMELATYYMANNSCEFSRAILERALEGNYSFLHAMAGVDVCEANNRAIENMEIKKQTFQELSQICKPECMFATNTSSLSITEIGAKLDRPIIGMHFFNPAPVMKLVEVIAAEQTPQEMVDKIVEISKELGKTPVVVKEAAGFVVNRILVPLINEGAFVLSEGLASAEDIDIAMQLGCNHPMGPLHLGDLIGWDVVLNIMDVLYNETHDSKYRANVLIRKMVRAGKLGIKSGEGFFNYNK